MQFYYAARTADSRAVSGCIEAGSREGALEHLRARSLCITSIERAASVQSLPGVLRAFLTRSSASRRLFFRSFATLIGAGIPVQRALHTLIAQSDPVFSEMLHSVAVDVENGSPLSRALARHPRDISAVAVAMIGAGEAAGHLDESLRAVAEMEERNRLLRGRVSAALAYPLAVSAVAFGVVVFLVTHTMPSFAELFGQMRVPLPETTKVLIAVGSVLRTPWPWLAIASGACAGIAAWRASRSSVTATTIALERRLFRLPLAGAVLSKMLLARLSSILGRLLEGGVEITIALELAGEVVESAAYRAALRAAVGGLRRGESLAAALEAQPLFDPLLLQLIRVGEESGMLDAMLQRVSHLYEQEAEHALKAMTSLLEPALICAIGGVIAIIVASIIIPLYSMIGAIR